MAFFLLVEIQSNKLLRFVAFTHPLLHTEHLFYLSLPFNPTSNRLKGNRSQWPLKADHIHVNPQNQSCQIMLVLCLIHFVSTLPFIQPAKRARLTRSSICSIPLAFDIGDGCRHYHVSVLKRLKLVLCCPFFGLDSIGHTEM